MPITKSAIKAVRQNKRRQAANLIRKKAIKKLSKEIRLLIEQKDLAKAKELLPKYYKALGKAAKTGFIKKGRASRRQSRMAKMINKSR